jgi:outer membrane biosynthesis protein TonB
MKVTARFPLLLAAVALCALAPSVRADEADDEQPLRIIQTVEAKFPHEATARGIRTGEVHAVLLVDAEGHLVDCLITAFTQPEFAVELLNVVRSWEFEPARQKGEPTSQRTQIIFRFDQRGAIVSMLPAMSIAARMNNLVGEKLQYFVCRATELDRVPAAIEKVSPKHPGKTPGAGVQNGSAQIDFYIDADGRPRMPVVMKATHVAYAAAAADALMQWRFEPPTYQGRPVSVRLVQEFLF